MTSVPPDLGAVSSPIRSAWTEHRNAQGRVYWYNQAEKRSVWEKPAELKTARERAIDSTPWKEYQSGERKYYVHSVTKESSWTLPQELKDLLDSLPAEPSPAPGTPVGLHSPGPAAVMSPAGADGPRPVYSGPPPSFAGQGGQSMNGAVPGPAGQPGPSAPPPDASLQRGPLPSSMPVAGGEDAFFQLLREKNVDQSWTWEQTMREIITEPLYKSLATLAERKAAFSKYISNLKEQEERERKARARELEPRIRNSMQPLIDNGQIPAWLSYDGMLCRCTDQSGWKALESIGLTEARDLWATIRKDIRDKTAASMREIRHRNMDLLMSLLRSFEASVTTRWKSARQTIEECSEWQNDPHLKTMDASDMLIVFDEHINSIEKEKAGELRDKTLKRKRQDRELRDWFREELQVGKREGWLSAKSDFTDIYDRYRRNEKFISMLGQPGSTALDLFFDVIDDLESHLKETLQIVEPLLRRRGQFAAKEDTTVAEFDTALQDAAQDVGGEGAEIVAQLTIEEKTMLLGEMQRVKQEENRRSERKLRHLSEDLRYALKKVAYHQPELYENEEELGKPWPQVKAQIVKLRLPEWAAFDEVSLPIESDRLEEARKGAWERFVKRQKEKMEERKAREMEKNSRALSQEPASPRKRRGEEGEEDDRRRSSRRAGRAEDDEASAVRTRGSRRERRAGEMDETKERERERERKERRRSTVAEESDGAVKRPRLEDVSAPATEAEEGQEGVDSEKEEGEV